MDKPLKINKLCLVGVGLIGGSWLKALRQSDAVDIAEVVGVDRDAEQLAVARQLSVIDRGYANLSEALIDVDLCILAVPVNAMAGVLSEIAAHQDVLAKNVLITDVGSVKGCVLDSVKQAFGRLLPRFVAGHPIAGAESSGVAAAKSDLFARHKVILTPHAEQEEAAIGEVSQLWQAAGAQVVTMDVAHHDEVLALTSHLPHLLAYSLVHTLAQQPESQDVFRYAAGGFRDFTRIASSDPVMWHDIFLANKTHLLSGLDSFTAQLQLLRDAVESDDSDFLLATLGQSKVVRDDFAQRLSDRSGTKKS